MINQDFLTNIRKKNNWTQEEMAKFLGVSRPTYMSLEKGNGSLTIDQLNKLAEKIGCQPEDILSEKIIDEDKYREVLLETIRQGSDKDGKITKTKLAKLIYLNDFGWYYKHLESMTGAKYRKLPLGPVPNFYFSTIDELFERGQISVEIKHDGIQMISLAKEGEKSKNKILKDDEVSFIKTVAKKWKNVRTKEIVRFTHDQLPYKICSDGEIIPYELITQQDPDYVY